MYIKFYDVKLLRFIGGRYVKRRTINSENMDDRSIRVLTDIQPREKYKGLGEAGKNIVKTESYLSLLGRLRGFRDVGSPETQSITTTIDGTRGDADDVLNALLVGILERHQIGGGFFEYPRIFLVGPDQIDKSPTKHDQMPYLRDVDRIMWVGSYTTLIMGGGTRYFYLGYVDLWNEDYASPSEAKSTQGYFYFYPRTTGAFPFEEHRNKVVKNIVKDGGEWTLRRMGDIGENMAGSGNGTEIPLDQILILGWIAQILARERVLPDFSSMINEARESRTMNAMLATAMIDTVAFNTATQLRDQQTYETSLGYLTPEKLRIVYVGINKLRSEAAATATTANRIGRRTFERNDRRKENNFYGRSIGDDKDSTSSPPPILHRTERSRKNKEEDDDLIGRTLSDHARISEGLDHLGRWIAK